MKPRRAKTWAVALAVLLVGTTIFLFRPHEPSHDGKSLGDWLAAFTESDLRARMQAHRAIRAMGTNIVPHLTKRGFHRDSELKLKWMQLAYRQTWIDFKFMSTNERRVQVAGALEALGNDARPMLTTLTNRIHDDETWTRSAAAWALGVVAQDMSATVPALAQALADPEWQVRLAAVIALGEIGFDAASAASELIHLLEDKRWVVRVNAVKTLGLMGPAAREAIPALNRLVLTEERRIRTHAIRALSRIDLEPDRRAEHPD